MSISHGVYLAQGMSLPTGVSEITLLAGADVGSCDVLVHLASPVAHGGPGVEVFTHPVSPAGTYYPAATQVALATGVIAHTKSAVRIPHSKAPMNVFGITVVNHDTIGHEVDVVIYGNGAS